MLIRILRLQLDVPIEPVVPGIVQVIRREAAAMFLQMPARRADRRDVERHMGLFGGAAALFQVAGRAGGDNVFPGGAALLGAGDDVIKGEIAT